MKKINLKYDTTPMEFLAIKFYENIVSEKIKGDTLSATKFENVSGKRREWLISFTAENFIDTVKLSFIKNYYTSNSCYLSYDSGAWIEVVINEDGTMPIEYVNDIVDLKTITITLTEKYAYTGSF